MKSSQIGKICADRWKSGIPIFTANHAGGKWLYEIRQVTEKEHVTYRILSVIPFFSDM